MGQQQQSTSSNGAVDQHAPKLQVDTHARPLSDNESSSVGAAKPNMPHPAQPSSLEKLPEELQKTLSPKKKQVQGNTAQPNAAAKAAVKAKRPRTAKATKMAAAVV